MAVLTVDPLLGLRGTTDFTTGQRPEDWRGMIARLFPNGDMPLTALTNTMKSSKAKDPRFHWSKKNLPSQNADLVDSGIYIDVSLATAYVSGGVTNDVVYAKIAAADMSNFRVGHAISIRKGDDARGDVMTELQAKGVNYLQLGLLQNADTTVDLNVADVVGVRSNANPEGGNRPDAISYRPEEFDNYTQIFRNSLDITRTAKETTLRTGDAYQEDKRDALELHGIEIEKGLIWGVKALLTGSNGKPKRYTDGLINTIKVNVSANVSDFRFDTAFSGKTWAESGKDWLDTRLETIFRYGDRIKFTFVGSLTLKAISDLAQLYGTVNLEPGVTSFGMKVNIWIHSAGEIVLKQHPLFQDTDADRRSMVVFEPRHLEYKFITDTVFIPDVSKGGGDLGKDSTAEEYLTECGLQYDFVEGTGYLSGFGLNNTV